MDRDAILLGAFVAGVLVLTWHTARRDAFYAGYLVFFLLYTVFAMVGYRFFPLLSIVINSYFGQALYYTYFWFVAGSFAAYYVAFRLLAPRLLGTTTYDVSYRPRNGSVWAVLSGMFVLILWLAVTLARIYSRIDYGSTPQIPSFAFAFVFTNSPFLILVLYVFARRHARGRSERVAAYLCAALITAIFLLTATKASKRVDVVTLATGFIWLELAPVFLDQRWRLRIRWNRETFMRIGMLAVGLVALWTGLAAIRGSRGDAGVMGQLPGYVSVLFNDYYAPAHILFASIGFDYVKPLLVLKSNIANSLLIGGALDVPYLQTDIGNMLIPGTSSRSTGFAYYIFSEGYMALGRWGVLYNGIVPVMFIALIRRAGRTSDAHYNALVGAMGAMFFATVARSGNHLLVRFYLFSLLPALFLFRYLSGARLRVAATSMLAAPVADAP